MKILITGATGSLGGYLTRYFSQQGHEIIASGQMENPPLELHKYAEYLQADITKAFEVPEIDVCIHTAALSDDKATEKELFAPNVLGTENIANATKNCKKFIHVSSSSVYLPSEDLLTEEMAGKQDNAQLSNYGKSKLLSENKLIDVSEHESCFILRPRAFYGEGDKMIFPRLLKLVKGNTLQLPGSLEINVSMTHYLNIAKAIELCINSDKKGINIYNVADERVYRLIDVMRKLTSIFYGKTLQEKQIPIWVLKAMSLLKIGGITKLLIRAFTQDMVLDISKIKKELQYQESINLDSSLEKISQWVESIGGPEVLKTGAKELAWKI